MKFLGIIKKLQRGGFYLGLLVVGLGFLVFTLLPVLMPGTWTTDSSPLTSILTGVIGVVAIVIAVIKLRKVFTTSLEEENYFNKVNTASVDPSVVEAIRKSDSPVIDCYFHYCGKLNQSYILETTDRQPVVEINCDKMGIVNDFIFTFKDHLTGKEFSSKVSHTVTSSYGSDNFSLVDSSYFKIDGQVIWDYIAEMGYSVEPYPDPVAFSYRIRHYGVEVTELKAAGTNILPQYEGKEGLRDMPLGGGLFKVSCREEDAFAVAMIAFAVSRVQVV